MNKRSNVDAFADEAKMRIKLANSAELDAEGAALEADKLVVRLFSTVARGLPETDEWDLSGLLVDGQSVSRATVVAWLNAAYQLAYRSDYQQQQEQGNPALNVKGLYLLLAFADAVGSTRSVLEGCCSRLEGLQLHATIGQQQQPLLLATDGTDYYFVSTGRMAQRSFDSGTVYTPGASQDPASAEEQQAFKQQVAAQTEQLLWLAYRLQLKPLVQRLHLFMQLCSRHPSSLLHNQLDSTFSARVLEAAGAAGVKDAWLSSVLGEVASFQDNVSGKHAETLLLPSLLTDGQKKPIKFNAVVQRSALPLQHGATVAVELDLFNRGRIQIGSLSLPVQLRIGNYPGASS